MIISKLHMSLLFANLTLNQFNSGIITKECTKNSALSFFNYNICRNKQTTSVMKLKV